jgi:hypothetical protein
MNQFHFVKSADAEVRRDIVPWENKVNDYVEEIFTNDMERVYGTKFGDNLSIIGELAENATTEAEIFRGVQDQFGRLQAAAIVH